MPKRVRYHLTAAERDEAERWAIEVNEAMTGHIDLSSWIARPPRWSCGRCNTQVRAWARDGDALAGWHWDSGASRCPACKAARAPQRKASR